MPPKIGYAAYYRARRKLLQEAGLCVQCGKRKPAKGVRKCRRCRGMALETDRARRARERAAQAVSNGE